jgi:microcystin-dependent protein
VSDQFVAEIRVFAGNFPPNGWAFCDGQLLPISQNPALFSLLGTTYGGNGTSNFALPNFQGSAPIQQGQGPGLSDYVLGESGGEQSVTLLTTELPTHTHTAMADTGAGTQPNPNGGVWAEAKKSKNPINRYAPSGTSSNVAMLATALALAGGSQPHNNMQPYLGLTFIIALTGIFPSRG